MSSAESELYAAGKAATESLGVQTLFVDIGADKKEVILYAGSSAALSLVHREGLGKAKHIESQHLWLQEAVKAKRLVAKKVASEENVADLMTKNLAPEKINYLMAKMGYSFIKGTAEVCNSQFAHH